MKYFHLMMIYICLIYYFRINIPQRHFYNILIELVEKKLEIHKKALTNLLALFQFLHNICKI